MTDDAFIRTICQAPHEDAPRLVYADWLEERGDERGEFIRVQIELARLHEPEQLTHGDLLCKTEDESILDHCVGCLATGVCGRPVVFCRWHELTKRSDELLATNRREWTMAGFPKTIESNDYFLWHRDALYAFNIHSMPPQHLPLETEFRRGFLELLTCRWEEWAAHHETLQREMPVTRVTLTTMPDQGFYWLGTNDDVSRASLLLKLESEWPGIEFVLPPPQDLVETMAERMSRRVAEDVERRILGLDVADGLDATVMAVTMMRGDGMPVLLRGPFVLPPV